MVPRVIQELLERREMKAKLVCPEFPAPREQEEMSALSELMVSPELQVLKETRETPVPKDPKVFRVRLDLKEMLVLMVSPENQA